MEIKKKTDYVREEKWEELGYVYLWRFIGQPASVI